MGDSRKDALSQAFLRDQSFDMCIKNAMSIECNAEYFNVLGEGGGEEVLFVRAASGILIVFHWVELQDCVSHQVAVLRL